MRAWCAALAVALLAPPAHAETIEAEPRPLYGVPLFAGGAGLLVASYVPSAAAALESPNPSDRYLWVPLVGPWLDLADRTGCTSTRNCGTESGYQALLIADGIAQDVGAILLATGLVQAALEARPKSDVHQRHTRCTTARSIGGNVMKPFWMSTLATGILCATTVASADGTTVVQAPPQQPTQAVVVPPREDRVVERRAYYPNVPLIVTGATLFAGTYIASAVVAGTSDNESDRRLYVPLIGPWLDLADRGGCPVGATSCDRETTNKVLLVGDGVLQAVGTIAFVTGFLVPGRAEVVRQANNKPTVRVLPMSIGRGASMGAGIVGTF